ncbi:uncharacterized protein BCR38DRAFT_73141 [Pseudomassariella vexata]|uniref:Uncharacterized protein n=1 Tax=Pseudomassariella vexata TaxID=1141098 RepID=A0A1Y2DGP1_9PEZI|nr:uncharacterized protein BCR38DRAFT_73141 [Pseudomassariella vexata]ORY58443.1 hypothetical protein BCR38DRAFT_73141 [Pseudomassariella vexata]
MQWCMLVAVSGPCFGNCVASGYVRSWDLQGRVADNAIVVYSSRNKIGRAWDGEMEIDGNAQERRTEMELVYL